MNPNQLYHCNHIEKGVIFLRIRGEIVKPWTNGKRGHVSTTHLKLLMLVEGSYCWEVVGGRTVSPFPHAHSTSRLLSSRRQENHDGIYSIVLLILMHRILPGFYSRSELGAVFCHPQFPCEGPFTFFCCVYVFLTNLWLVYMFFPCPAENLDFLFHLRTM